MSANTRKATDLEVRRNAADAFESAMGDEETLQMLLSSLSDADRSVAIQWCQSWARRNIVRPTALAEDSIDAESHADDEEEGE